MAIDPYAKIQNDIMTVLNKGVLKKPFSSYQLQKAMQTAGISYDLDVLQTCLGYLVDSRKLGVFFQRYIYEGTKIPILTAKQIIEGVIL